MSVKIQTIKDIRNYLLNELKEIYPEQEIMAITNLIFKTQFGIDRLHLALDSNKNVSSNVVSRIFEISNELKTGKPVQYVLGETSFYDCTIKVDNETLIPRPETEELVGMIIRENKDFDGRITDIGTGTGCIAIALKKNLPDSKVTGIDISEPVLEIASSNAILNNVAVTFLKADILHPDSMLIPRSEIIVSNPPYVLESEKQLMMKNVLDFEPHSALFVPDDNPLVFYKAIINLSESLLIPGGRLYFEINENKGDEIQQLMISAGYSGVKIIRDINGKNRFVKGIMNG
jgi:release factor glutamine methyltransferase